MSISVRFRSTELPHKNWSEYKIGEGEGEMEEGNACRRTPRFKKKRQLAFYACVHTLPLAVIN